MRNRSFSYERAATMDEDDDEEEEDTDDAGEEDDWYPTANGDDPNAQRLPIVASSSSLSEAKRTLRNFILMSILFSANHGCVVGKGLSYESIENLHPVLILPKTHCICFFSSSLLHYKISIYTIYSLFGAGHIPFGCSHGSLAERNIV